MSTDPSLKETSRPGKLVSLGKYEVVAHIATGGMGAIYRARDRETGQEVALKVLNAKMAKRTDALQRFHAEGRNAAQLRHENIVQVFEVAEYKGVTYMAMEFVPGVDLADHIFKHTRLDIAEAIQITFQAARALHHAFKRGIVHRDIKPSNIMVTRKDDQLLVKLTDLGLSRQVDDEEFKVTRAGYTVGTIDYISPEQARDSRSADVRSDIYSLGCTLYHMLTGKSPFSEGGLAERLLKHMETPPDDVRTLRPEIPAALAKVVATMLLKNPDERYQTPRELLHALTLAERDAAAPTKERKKKQKPRRKAAETETVPETRTAAGPRMKSRKAATEKDETVETPRPERFGTQGIILGSAAGVLLLAIVLLLVLRPWKSDDSDPDGDRPNDPGPIVRPPIVKDKPPADKDKPKDGGIVKPPPVVWPALRPDAVPLNTDRLSLLFSEGWDEKPLPADLPVYRVRRRPTAPGQYASIKEALRAVQEKGGVVLPGGDRPYDAVVEIEDDGPLHETSAALTGKSVLIRAASGHRPLVCWDVERELDRPLPPLLTIKGGRLALEGLEIVVPGERPLSDVRAAVIRAAGGVLVRRCVFSVAGTHPAGVDLLRLDGEGKDAKSRCRLSRCLIRGGSVVPLAIDGGPRDVLIDDSLLTTGRRSLVEIQARAKQPIKLMVLRSTLVGRGEAVRVTTDETEKDLVEVTPWDSIIARSGPGREGTMVQTPPGRFNLLRWRGAGSLYTGWKELATGHVVEGNDLAAWERLGPSHGCERAETTGWPSADFPELAVVQPGDYAADRVPGRPVGFASTSWPCLAPQGASAPKAIGCPVSMLPAARDRWLQWTTQRWVVPPVELLTSSSAPDIPPSTDMRYTGDRLDVTKGDVGAYLEQVLKSRKPAAKVVLRLHRSAGGTARLSSPIRIKDANLVLHLEPLEKGTGKDKTSERLLLQATTTLDLEPGAFIEVDNGNLDIVGGELKASDYSQLIRVKNGLVKLHDVRLTAPSEGAAPKFDAAVLLESASLGMHECVVNSGRSGVIARGSRTRLRIVNSVVVAGRDAVVFEPGTEKTEASCSFESSTVAAARAAVSIDRIPVGSEEPLVVLSRATAFLNPFGGKGGLLLHDADSLRLGLLLWQGDKDLFDKRLHFAIAATIPDKPEGMSAWADVWGASGASGGRLEFQHSYRFEANRIALSRLTLLPVGKSEPLRDVGADLEKLGLVAGKSPR